VHEKIGYKLVINFNTIVKYSLQMHQHHCLRKFTELEKWAQKFDKQSGSESGGLFGVGALQ